MSIYMNDQEQISMYMDNEDNHAYSKTWKKEKNMLTML